MLRSIKLASFVLAAMVVGAPAHSAPLVSTGQGLAPGTTDPNWVITSTTAPLSTPFDPFVVNPATPFWILPPAGTNWISPYMNVAGGVGNAAFNCVAFCPANDPNATRANQTYTYTLDFSLPVPTTIEVKWASDNGAVFELDGVPIPGSGSGGFVGTLAAFSVAVGAGAHAFDVIVTNLAQDNNGNPTGLIAQVSTSAVPLPPALLLFGSVLGLNWLRRRRRGSGSAVATA